MHFRTRTWFIISLLCFFAAAVFWQLAERKAERDRARQPVESSAPASGLVPSTGGQPGSTGGTPAPAPVATTNAATISTNDPFRFRLSNTAKGVDELSRSEQALLLRNALIDSSVPVALPIPQHLRAQGDPGSYVVQSRAPLTDAYRTMLRNAGAELISYVPNNAYLVRATEAVAK